MNRTLEELSTPALLLDSARLAGNIERMNARTRDLGVRLRPHAKTAKSLDVAHRIFGGGVGPLTVSTLKEARYFADGGFLDLLYAVGMAADKLEEVQALRARGVEMTVVLDHPDVASELAARASGKPLPVMIEVDTDGHRAGLAPDDPRLVDTARIIDRAGGLALVGIMTHAGESYTAATTQEIALWARRERDGAVAAAGTIRDTGLAVPTVSVGSTPTACFADHLNGVDELRAGVYVFQDLFQAGLGVCSLDDIAVSVLATVISHRPDKGWLIIDAGGLALSKDRSTASQVRDQGFGRVCGLDGRPIGELIVDRADQEHGIVVARDGGPLPQSLTLGDRVRVLPNHSCMTAAAYEHYELIEGDCVVGRWGRVNGW